MREHQAFDFRHPGQKRQAIPPRKTLAPGTGNYYQQPQGTRATNHPTRHRNVERLDKPTRTGTQGRADVYGDPRPEHFYRRTPDGKVEIDDEYPPRMPNVTRRYDTGLDTHAGKGKRYRVDDYFHDEPLDIEGQPAYGAPLGERRPRRHIQLHRFVYVGVGLFLMLAGYIAFNLFGAWWQVHQDDVTYGNPRTFQTDAVVGHADSASHPTHFIAMNLKGQVIVIELPGGDTSKARSYNITTIPDNSSNPPVKVVFQDLTHDGKMDMVVEIGDPGSQVTIFLYNNGSQFVPKL